MRLAFYAPLKSPNHTVPSGDREIARGLIKALEELGAEVTLASTLRSRDGIGDPANQADILAKAHAQIPELIRHGADATWKAWITYHNYYKAPDLIGPTVAKALNIPYIQIESTRARKRLIGPWAAFAKCAEVAADAADVIFYFTARDAQALKRDAPDGQLLLPLSPFLPRTDLPTQGPRTGPMLAVGMMRPGDKYASYHIIAETLALLTPRTWELFIAGDGAMRSDVENLMAPFGDAVHFLGAQSSEQMTYTYQAAGFLFWPGVNEAFGLAYLEAQAHGLPVVAQARLGVGDVLSPGVYPSVESGPEGLSRMITPLLQDADHRREAGDAARHYVARNHLLPAAAAQLSRGLKALGVMP